MDSDLDCNLTAVQKMHSFIWDIHCSIQQCTSHCCSLFSHCYIAVPLISGLILSRSQSRLSVYTGQNFSIQMVIQMILHRALEKCSQKEDVAQFDWLFLPDKYLRHIKYGSNLFQIMCRK